MEALTKYWDNTESEAEDHDNKGNKEEDLDAPNKADEDQGHQREDHNQENRGHNLSEGTDDGMHIKTKGLEMSDQEDDDTINDEVGTIKPTSGTDTHKADDELMISDGWKEYDDLIKDQFLNDIDNKEDKTMKAIRKFLVIPTMVLRNMEQ